MDEQRHLKCACLNCGGRIEFPEGATGTEVPCPHCGWKTSLSGPDVPQAQETAVRRGRPLGWVVVLAVVAGLGVGAVFYARWGKVDGASPTPGNFPRPTNAPVASIVRESPTLTNALAIGTITLEKAGKGTVVYAVGSVRNESERQRFGLKIELDVFDRDGLKVGTASDYLAILEPRKEWRFKALVLDAKGASARLAGIREDQ